MGQIMFKLFFPSPLTNDKVKLGFLEVKHIWGKKRSYLQLSRDDKGGGGVLYPFSLGEQEIPRIPYTVDKSKRLQKSIRTRSVG